MNFANAGNLAMRKWVCECEFRKGSEFRNAKWVCEIRKVGCEFRNAKFAKWVVNFAMRNFTQVGTNEQCIGIAKLKLALRNWHCEIFALRI